VTPEVLEAIEGKANELARKLSVPVQPGQAYAAINGLDGFEKVETDDTDLQRHQAQFTGHFLLDRDGVVRWASIEGPSAGLAGLPLFPTEEELMAAARAL